MNTKEGFFKKPAVWYFPVIVVILLAMMTCLGTSSALAATGTAGDYTVNRSYSYGSGYSVSLKSYNGTDTDLVLPATVTINEQNYAITNTGNFLTKSQKKTITSVIIPEGYTTIDTGTFEGCTSLQSVTLPASMRMISANAFAGCTALKNIEIADGEVPLRLNNAIFANCTSLESVTLPARLSKSDGSNVFYGCTSLKEVLITGGDNYKNDDQGALYAVGDNGLTLVTYPEGKTQSEFQLPSAVGDAKVTALGPHALRDNATLEKLTVPETITTFERFSVSDCSHLKTLILEGKDPLQISIGAFRNMAADSTIFVSSDQVKASLESEADSLYTASSTTVKVMEQQDSNDLNQDGKVDLLDIAQAQQFYKTTSQDQQWAKAKVADLNHDNQVDMEDLVILYGAVYN